MVEEYEPVTAGTGADGVEGGAVHAPKVSIIVPVYNPGEYLAPALYSLAAQTMGNFEALLVDDGSTDGSLEALYERAAADSRFRVIEAPHGGAGAARNAGMDAARGEYLYFSDSDDLCDPHLLELAVDRAEKTGADIVAFGFHRFAPDGSVTQGVGVHTEWLPEGTEVFSWRDCPDRIMNAVNPTPWNKLYRASFVCEAHLRFEEISSTNDVTFAAVSAAAAERIAVLDADLFAYRVGTSGTITSDKQRSMGNVVVAVESAMRQVEALPHAEQIYDAATYFAAENYQAALWRYVTDPDLPQVRAFYEAAHALFSSNRYAEDALPAAILANERLHVRVRIIRSRSYEEFRDLWGRRLVVSMTSYPARIGFVSQALDSIWAQTRPADEVELWLASEQFPGGVDDLPEEILDLAAQGRLSVRWCADLKPHKKYFYAMLEHPHDAVVTVDDDLIYEPRMLENLFDSYLLFPHAVSAVRAHLVVVDPKEGVLPYENWVFQTDALLHEPSMQLMATGGAGALYPPGLLDPAFFDEAAIREVCPLADDIWLKAAELISGVPVAVAQPSRALRYVPGSQEEALWRQNRGGAVGAGGNDEQLARVMAWVDERYGEGVFMAALCSTEVGTPQLGPAAYARHVAAREQRIQQAQVRQRSKLRVEARKAEARSERLEGRVERLRERNARLKARSERLAARNRELKAHNKQLSARNRKASAELKRLRSSTSWKIGRAITWLPRKLKALLKRFK